MNSIYLELELSGESFKYMYIDTPFSIFMSGQKKAKNSTLARHTLGATRTDHT